MGDKIRISGTGCALADFVYMGINFNSPEFLKYMSLKEGDGGLSPGKLVFTEELEKFAGKPYHSIISEITKDKVAETFNIGGPSIVSLIHAAQVLDSLRFEVDFYGISGKDEVSRKIRKLLKKTPVQIKDYSEKSIKQTPFTHVLSDPDFDNGNGERTFINNIGAAWDLVPKELPDKFFKAQIVCFGGTALTPNIHDKLHYLLEKAKSHGAITVVNTVYDFRNEKQNPGKAWPLGETKKSLPNIDILIMDNEEALQISACKTTEAAKKYFKNNCSAFIITRGSENTIYFSNGTIFKQEEGELPVSGRVSESIRKKEYQGDTTGCGDNFVGGVLVSLAMQIQNNLGIYNLKEAVISGICSGGFACSYNGGTYFEKIRGEKKERIQELIKAYQVQ